MKNRKLTTEYFFTATQHPASSCIHELTLLGANPKEFINGNIERIPPEITRLATWPGLHLFTQLHGIWGLPNDEPAAKEEISFYGQFDDLLFGEDLETNRAIFGRMYGPRDENNLLIPKILTLQVSQVRFNNINLFNYPTVEHAQQWEKALEFKYEIRSEDAA